LSTTALENRHQHLCHHKYTRINIAKRLAKVVSGAMDVKALRSSSFLIPPRQYDTNAKEATVETLLQGNAATPVRHSRVMVMSTKEGWCRFNVVHC
jgi:hypothetical protein